MGRQIDSGIPAKQIAGLDGLRGIAILGVVGYHLAPHTVSGGFLGVNLFFVLSGYLMAVTSRRAQEESGFHVGTFYCKRISRIYPALILAVCATLFLAQFLAPDSLRGIRCEVLSIFSGSNNWWQIVQNASYFTRITGASPFTHLWSLSVEMQFYILWPLLFLGYTALNRRGRRGAGLFILLIIASVLTMLLLFRPEEDPSRVYYGTDTRIFALLVGGLLGLHPKRSRRRRRGVLKRTAGFLLLLAGFLWFYFIVDGQSALTYWLILAPSALIASGLIGLCADSCLSFGRWLDCPPLAWLGRRSYELYLVQYPVIFFIQRRQPTGSEPGDTLIAVVLILLGAQWLHQVTAVLQNNKRWRRSAVSSGSSMEFREGGGSAPISADVAARRDRNPHPYGGVISLTTKPGGNLMRKRRYKIREMASLLLAGIVVAGGAYALLTALGQSVSDDQQQLQQELQKNSDLLAGQTASDCLVIPIPSVVSDQNPADSASMECTSQEQTPPVFTAIGDSVMLGAVPEMQRIFPDGIIDAKESRQVWDAGSVTRELDAKGELRDIVVVALGSNGSFGKSSGQEVIDALGPDRTIYWIAPYGRYLNWQESVIRVLNELAEENENVTILNWPETASQHTDWFYDDGMHLNAEGQTGYAEFLLERLNESVQDSGAKL